MSRESAEALKREVRACTICAQHLPLGPRPLVQFSSTSRILIIGQAPGRITHERGRPFDDASGERLADWLGMDFEAMHDSTRVAIVSMGLCYPGKAGGGDSPPRPECAPAWHERIFAELPEDRLTLLDTRRLSMTERVRRHADFTPFFSLPHPSWRSTIFMRDNPWFEDEVLPELRRAVGAALGH